MTRILILGANGQLARNTTRVLLRDTDAQLTLYLRRASRLENPDPTRVTIVEGDVLDTATLTAAVKGHDVIYANLAGDMKRQAEAIIDAMHATGVKRLVFAAGSGPARPRVARRAGRRVLAAAQRPDGRAADVALARRRAQASRSARGRTRTGTGVTHGNLNPARLPISPLSRPQTYITRSANARNLCMAATP
jgi:putative NADH-flavin reductase